MFKVDLSQETIRDLKAKIFEKEAYPCELMAFMLNGKYVGGISARSGRADSESLEGKTLTEFGVEADITLVLTCRWLRLRGQKPADDRSPSSL